MEACLSADSKSQGGRILFLSLGSSESLSRLLITLNKYFPNSSPSWLCEEIRGLSRKNPALNASVFHIQWLETLWTALVRPGAQQSFQKTTSGVFFCCCFLMCSTVKYYFSHLLIFNCFFTFSCTSDKIIVVIRQLENNS